ALLMANLQAMLHVLLPIDVSLSEATGQVNDIIHQNTPPDKFITFFWGLIDPQDLSFRFVNAGHNPPICLKAGSDTPAELQEGGLILGAMPTLAPYREQTISLSPGDVLVFYTDGVTEAMNKGRTEEFGEKRLLKSICKHRDQPAAGIEQAIIDDVQLFASGIQSDDITVMVVRVN